MLQLTIFGTPVRMAEVAERVKAHRGARHVITTDSADSLAAQVTADVSSDCADSAIQAVRELGVPPADIVLVRVDSIGPAQAQRPLATVVWADLLTQAGVNARPFARYLVFMATAGVVAGFGVLYANVILIVGAMAISPDTLPITATCTALILRRWRLAARAFTTLTIGLGLSCVVAALGTAVLDLFDLLPDSFTIDHGVLQGLQTVNISTPFVALAAGVAGMLALETRASSSVGVAISVTTIPASAYLGVAVGVGEAGKAAGALAVLAINVAMLLVGGLSTLAVQRRLARSSGNGDSVRE